MNTNSMVTANAFVNAGKPQLDIGYSQHNLNAGKPQLDIGNSQHMLHVVSQPMNTYTMATANEL